MLEKLNGTTLEYVKLSEDEMKSRRILGRLVGPCADFINGTRNERKYSEKLWEAVFSSDLMKERIENGVCYGELGHPTDREETDMEKVAICLPEVPKKDSNGHLQAVFDILDTPNGRILKTFCDYGSTLGISSRGTGELDTDIYGNEEVIPETYQCEGFDIVLLPAVKEARLKYVTESLNQKQHDVTLREKLAEAIEKEDDSKKSILKESLTTLGVDLDEAKKTDKKEKATPYSVMLKTYKHNRVFTDREKQSSEFNDTIEWLKAHDKKYDVYEDTSDKGCTVFYEDLKLLNSTIESPQANWRDLQVGDRIKVINTLFGVSSIEEDEVTEVTPDYVEVYPINTDEVRTGRKYSDNNWENVKVIESSTVDNDKVVLDHLQEQLKVNKKLEQMVTNLQEQLSVSYAKETSLTEKLSNAEKSVTRLAETSKSNKALVGKVAKLSDLVEQLNREKTESYKKLNESNSNKGALKSELSSKETRIATLSEQLKEKADENIKLTESIENMEKQTAELKEGCANKLKQTTALVEKYQRIAHNAVNYYIESKAVSLGVKPQEIKNRLPESYNFKDIDKVCESLRQYSINLNNLPFSTQLNESVSVSAKNINQNDMLVPRNTEDDITDLDMRLAEMFK